MLQGMTAHYLCTDTFPLKPGHTCLVHAAAGGVGLLLVQMAKRRGARVIGTVGTEAKAALARGAGADDVVLYSEEDFLEAGSGSPGAGRGRGVRLGGEVHRGEEPRLPRSPRHDGLLRERERPRGPDRPARPLPQGLALPHAAEPDALHRRPSEPRGPGGGRAGRRGGRPALGAHRPDLPPRRGGGRPPGPRGAEDDRQGAAPPVIAREEYPGGGVFEVVTGDLLEEPVDAIVNAANGRLAHGGGVAAAIARAAGPALVEEGDRIVAGGGPIEVGEAVVTTAGRLPFKGVVHAVGPHLGLGQEEDRLVQALGAAFRRAHERGWESVSFPPSRAASSRCRSTCARGPTCARSAASSPPTPKRASAG